MEFLRGAQVAEISFGMSVERAGGPAFARGEENGA